MTAKTKARRMESVNVLARNLFIQETVLGWAMWYLVLASWVELVINSFIGSYSMLKNDLLVLNNPQLSEYAAPNCVWASNLYGDA